MRLTEMLNACLCVTTMYCCATAVLWGQRSPGGVLTISGEVTCEGARIPDSLNVELVSSGRVIDRAAVAVDGRFELSNVTYGEYEVRLTDHSQVVVQPQFVSVHGPTGDLVFRLEKDARDRPVSGTVSANRLLHRPPATARKELLRAAQASNAGDAEESRRHLCKALAIFPNYADARNDLGAWYMRHGSYAQAAAEFQEAARLDPGAARPNTNLALAWIAMGRYAEAKHAARLALASDPTFAPAKRALTMASGR